MTGGARVPFVVGIDRYLPAVLGRVHSRFGSPWVALVTVGVVSTVTNPTIASVSFAVTIMLFAVAALYFGVRYKE